MTSGTPETEILVHITAPSRATDDAGYRTLAAAYLAFEPGARTSLGPLEHSTAREETTGKLPATEPPLQQPPVPALTADPFVSPELSFGSVAHNLNSPGLRRDCTRGAGEVSESQSSWRAPPSVIEDSIPDNNISIARYSSPTRILEHYLQGFDSSQSNLSSQPLPPAEPISSPTRPADRLSLPAASAATTLAAAPETVRSLASSLLVIPSTPASTVSKGSAPVVPPVAAISSLGPDQQSSSGRPPAETRRSKRKSTGPSETSIIIASSFPGPTADAIPSSRADSEPPPPPKRQKRWLSGITTSSLVRSSSDIGPRQQAAKNSKLARRQRARHRADGLEIRAPEPPVGCGTLTVSDVVTRKLEKLAQDVDIKKRFRPKELRRELRPFERGYWSVDCSAWPDEVKRGAWGFLTNYVSNGDAGWGVWCRREDDYSRIRLYCWGCAAGHMYLLLYLASRRELNYTRTTWVGGDGQVVVVMDPKYQRLEVS